MWNGNAFASYTFIWWLAFDTDFNGLCYSLSGEFLVLFYCTHQIVNNCCKSIFELSQTDEEKKWPIHDCSAVWRTHIFIHSIICFRFPFALFQNQRRWFVLIFKLDEKNGIANRMKFHRVKVHSKTWYSQSGLESTEIGSNHILLKISSFGNSWVVGNLINLSTASVKMLYFQKKIPILFLFFFCSWFSVVLFFIQWKFMYVS